VIVDSIRYSAASEVTQTGLLRTRLTLTNLASSTKVLANWESGNCYVYTVLYDNPGLTGVPKFDSRDRYFCAGVEQRLTLAPGSSSEFDTQVPLADLRRLAGKTYYVRAILRSNNEHLKGGPVSF
jgi:hypothetical protein